MKKINLITNFYVDSNTKRQEEIEYCIYQNLKNPLINSIILFISKKDWDSRPNKNLSHVDKIVYILQDERPTYNDYFKVTERCSGINIISNTDIYFNETLQLVKDYDWKKDICFALCRWDAQVHGYPVHYNHRDSQDCWIFYGAVNQMKGADFGFGICGCDNKIAFLLVDAGYNVIDPSLSVQSIHVHLSGIRNYDVVKDRVPPPYKLLDPQTI